ncbi:sensor histidine kinase [Rhodothermus profundi]|uniref:sensor histidine kinase n=1 Tax=Rhodothermus profundi TaxID=633813 RepID=UPI000ACD91C2|nr:HAMP domain-containing sensor histidine kinase [Rhodothermus profundi]
MRRLLYRVWRWIFPPRASVRTWMFLTFALFVGLAVLGVGLYTGLVLHGRLHNTMEQTLRTQAERLLYQVVPETPSHELPSTLALLSRVTGLHLTLARGDSIIWSGQAGQPVPSASLPRLDTLVSAEASARFFSRLTAEGQIFYLTLYDPASGWTVQVGQPAPLWYQLARQMELTLVLGMLAALLLALLGSWIATEKVTAPLRAIRNSARNIIEGHFDEKIQVHTRAAEFQDLAHHLNEMSDSFREKIAELQRLTRLQTEFIGNVSHEVRNPIFSIGGYLEALASPTMDPETRKRYVEKALQNLNRLNNLFNDLIEIARLEYRADLIHPSVFNLQEVVEEVVDMLRPKAEEKGLIIQAENDPVFVRADRERIRQVLTNLIDNAISYTDEGYIRCRIRRRRDKVHVEVVDTGRGIPEEHLDRIFERFYRVDPDRSRRSGGTGLGLSIVKQILQAHGEAIHVESTVGRGSRFWFELPYAAADEAVSA